MWNVLGKTMTGKDWITLDVLDDYQDALDVSSFYCNVKKGYVATMVEWRAA